MLTSKIIEHHSGGLVSVNGYGGFKFKPVQIISDDKGIKLKALIEELRLERRVKIKDLEKEGLKRITSLLEKEE